MEKYMNKNPTNIGTATESSSGYAASPAQGHNTAAPQLNDGWLASSAKRNIPPCRADDSHGGKKMGYSGPDLPDDIWRHIHFLLPMKDAARAACVSRFFLSSWRCYPYLTFTNEPMCSKEKLHLQIEGSNVIADYNNNTDRVLTNHSGTGVTKFRLEYHAPHVAKSYHRLRSWLRVGVTPGIEELDLELSSNEATFKFPCKLLSERCQDSIRYLRLVKCAFRPKFDLALRNLKILHLCKLPVKEDKLECFLSNCIALEELKLMFWSDIIRLELPCVLQRLSFLEVYGCWSLEVIENKAPNISRILIAGSQVQLSGGKSLKVKSLKLNHSGAISYAIDNLPSCVPNLETLTITSGLEMVNAPVVTRRFFHLKFLRIFICGRYFHREYDYLSLVSFFDASPSLETFVLDVIRQSMYDSFEGDPSSLRRRPDHYHDNLKSVTITGFCHQKSMVELACHILENAKSLKRLTLAASPVNSRCSSNILDKKCPLLETEYIRQAHKTILAVRRYIEGKVPTKVKLNVLEPCSRCHAL